jgi:hypothetical protein
VNCSHFTYWRGVTVAVALLGCCAGASAENPSSPAEVAAPPSVEMREPQPGDHWVYRVKDEISGAVKRARTDTITEVTPNEITVRIQASDRDSPNVILYDGAWNIKQEFPFKYSPHDGNGVQLPLKVGAAWKSSVDIINTKEGMTLSAPARQRSLGRKPFPRRRELSTPSLSRRPPRAKTRKIPRWSIKSRCGPGFVQASTIGSNAPPSVSAGGMLQTVSASN